MQPNLRTSIFMGSLWLALCSLQGCSGEDWSKSALDQTEMDGDKVISALKHYRADENKYPPQLEQLVPKYIDKIPAPLVGNRTWQYLTNENAFGLVVESSDTSDPTLKWASTYGKWVVDDK
jgi:hypothetical protein